MGNAESRGKNAKGRSKRGAAAPADAGAASADVGVSARATDASGVSVTPNITIDDFELLKVVGKGRCVGAANTTPSFSRGAPARPPH